MPAPRVTTLSPLSAETGMMRASTSRMPGIARQSSHVADAEQRDDVGVPARLHLHAARRVHQDHREVRSRGAGRHVARVLLVARAVGDDVLAPVGVEVPVGDVDRDALLALGLQPVHQQGEVHLVAGRAPLAAVGGHGRQLVLEDLLRVVQQAPDQRALAVVHAAAGDEAQQFLGLVAAQEIGEAHGRHQKYPSRLRISIAAAWSKSIARLWRSDVRVTSISSITDVRSAACDRTAPESG
jgi:hypothetical protein